MITCKRCGRKLKSKASQEKEMGKTCEKKATQENKPMTGQGEIQGIK